MVPGLIKLASFGWQSAEKAVPVRQTYILTPGVLISHQLLILNHKTQT
jgi:hypothetical protein